MPWRHQHARPTTSSGDPRERRDARFRPQGQPILERPRPERRRDQPERDLSPELQRPGHDPDRVSGPSARRSPSRTRLTTRRPTPPRPSFVVPTANTSDFFGISFLNTQATPTSGINTGFSNAVLIRPGYAANSKQLYTNEFLSAIQPLQHPAVPQPRQRERPAVLRRQYAGDGRRPAGGSDRHALGVPDRAGE